MVPKITHSRSQLFSYLTDFEDGACVLGMSRDTYPKLFELTHKDIVEKAPKGWAVNRKGNCKYLWFPPQALNEDDLERIDEWKQKFNTYVLIGLNQHIEDDFTDELDFCMALDFNRDPKAEKRTLYGEAEYQLKYQRSRPYLATLESALATAAGDLPIPASERESSIVTYVPSDPEAFNLPRVLAKSVAKACNLEYMQADLLCKKSAMKQLTIVQKIPEWQKLYDQTECVSLKGDVEDQIVIVVDDLYQSGATIWCYARYLKKLGAKYIFGLPCVKSLRDTDNQ